MKTYKLFSVVVLMLLVSTSVYANDKDNGVIAYFSKALSLQKVLIDSKIFISLFLKQLISMVLR